MARFAFQWVEVEGVGPVLMASGPIGPNTSMELHRVLEEHERQGHQRIVIDCARVRVMSDLGLDVVVRYAEATAARGGGMTLVGVSAKVRVVLELLDLLGKFTEVRAEPLVPGTVEPFRLSLSLGASGRPGVELLEASGELDERTERAELDPIRHAARAGKLDLVLDCAGLRSLRGRGLEHLMRYARALDELGGSVALVGVSREVKAALETNGLERAFSVVCMERRAVPR